MSDERRPRHLRRRRRRRRHRHPPSRCARLRRAARRPRRRRSLPDARRRRSDGGPGDVSAARGGDRRAPDAHRGAARDGRRGRASAPRCCGRVRDRRTLGGAPCGGARGRRRASRFDPASPDGPARRPPRRRDRRGDAPHASHAHLAERSGRAGPHHRRAAESLRGGRAVRRRPRRGRARHRRRPGAGIRPPHRSPGVGGRASHRGVVAAGTAVVRRHRRADAGRGRAGTYREVHVHRRTGAVCRLRRGHAVVAARRHPALRQPLQPAALHRAAVGLLRRDHRGDGGCRHPAGRRRAHRRALPGRHGHLAPGARGHLRRAHRHDLRLPGARRRRRRRAGGHRAAHR